LQLLQLFTTASGLSSDAHASPAPNSSGDTWLLVVMTGVFQTPVFRVGSHLRIQGMYFVPRNSGFVCRIGFSDGSAVSPMPLTLTSGERCLIYALNMCFIRIHLR
jgi:hypothetical protein